MQIVQKPKPPGQAQVPAPPQPTSQPVQGGQTLPKTLPMVRPPPQPMQPMQPMQEPEQAQAQGAVTDFDDGIRQRDPNSGQYLASELDQMADFEYLGADPLRAIYQSLCWSADSLKKLAQTTPAVAALSPDVEKVLDNVATIGYQITNAAAELCRGLWNWPFTRVIINQQLETLIHPDERRIFDKLYKSWFDEVIVPVETGRAKYDPEVIKQWVGKHTDEIADPRGFMKLCSERYTAEKIAMRSAWTPTDLLNRQMPLGERKRTTTGLEQVFKKRPG